MLTIQPISSSSSSTYYTDKDNYYLSDKENLEKATRWRGKGARELGLSGIVESDMFLSLLQGKLPSGQLLGITIDGERKHRAGTDVTLSAPKSLSLLALVGKDKRLLDAHQKAVDAVVDRIEKMAAEARITANGNTAFEKTYNLVIASFLHTSSRDLDPQLHTHLAIMNMTQRLDKEWRALSSRDKKDRAHIYNGFREILYDNQHYFGLVYSSTLAKLVVECGYDIKIVDKYGNFEIKDVPQDYIDDNSKRRSEIKQRLTDKGLSGSKAAEKAALDTREKKKSISTDRLDQDWLKSAEKFNINFDEIISRSKENHSAEIKSDNLVQISKTAVNAVTDALDHLSNYNAKVHHSDLVRQAFIFSAGTIHHQEIENEIATRLDSESLLGVKNQTYTTKTLLDKEQNFVRALLGGNGKAFSLNIRQSGLVSEVLKSSDRVQLINVNGLTNEKEFLESIVNISDEHKVRTYVLHQTRSHTNRLKQTIKRDGETFWQKFKNIFKDEITHTVKGFTEAYKYTLENGNPSRRKDIIIVHDAQKLGYDDISKLTELASLSKSKIVLLNNKHSSEGYFAGNPIKALVDNNVTTHSTTTIKQKYDCKIINSKTPLTALCEKYTASILNNESVISVAVSKKNQLEMTQDIRAALKLTGHLSSIEKEYMVMSSETLSDSQKKHAKFYKNGDIIIRSPWTKQQEKFTVIETSNSRLQVTNKQGDKSFIDLKKDTDFLAQRSKQLTIATNDKLLLDSSLYYRKSRFEKGEVGIVTEIAKDGVSIDFNGKSVFLDEKKLKDTTISHAYVRRSHTLHAYYDEILITGKPHQISPNLIDEISEHSQTIKIISNEESKVSNRLIKASIKYSVADIVESHHQLVKRDISNAPAAIEKDIRYLAESLNNDKFTLNKEKVARQAVSYAVSKCAERDAAFTHKELLTSALLFSIGKADFDDIAPVLTERLKEGNLKYLETHWVTQVEMDLEKEIISFNKSNKNTLEPIVSNKDRLLDLNPKFTQGQKDAIALTLTNKDRFITIQGFAGVGKTTMMQEVKKIAAENNVAVFGITPTNKARDILCQNGIETKTVDDFLINDTDYPKQSLFILDEASMVGNQSYLDLQKKIISLDGRMPSTGDKTQLQSLSSGIPHELNIASKSQKVANMNDIVRQNPNPILKEAAYLASDSKIKLSHEKIQQIQPSDWVERDRDFKYSESIIEIPLEQKDDANDKNEPPKVPAIFEAISEDFLSRTKDCRDNTMIIIHANEDRETVNLLVRQGLQELGEINAEETTATRYIPKDLKKADLLRSESFSKGDILRFDKTFSYIKRGDYFQVLNHVENSNDLECKGPNGNIYIIDTIAREQGGLSVYFPKDSRLSIGEKIRFRRTDLNKGRLANDLYMVRNIQNSTITLESESGVKVIDKEVDNDKHWDYAYTDTAFTAQGDTDRLSISLQLSGRTKSTTSRSQLIDQTRASHHHTIYTDSHEKLLERTDDYKKQQETNKKSALLMHKEYLESKSKLNDIQKASNKNKPDISNQIDSHHSKDKFTLKEKRLSPSEIEEELKTNIDSLSRHLLGEPNKKLSGRNDLRFGSKGSLKVDLDSGMWKDFESNEGGNCFELIKVQLGMSDFKDALEFAKDFLSIAPKIEIVRDPKKSTNKQKNDNGFQEYARKLEKRSKPVPGTILEKYLTTGRGLTAFSNADIRYLDSISTYHKDKKTSVPALLAITYNDKNEVNHVQVTRLDPKNPCKDKDSNIVKQTYGSVNGLGVELNRNHTGKTTYLTEGVETGLSILEAQKDARVVTVLGKSNFANINLDRFGKDICFCLDNDGEATFSNKDVNKAINKAVNEGKNISIIIPEKDNYDLNDILLNDGKNALSKTLSSKISVDKFNNYVELNKAHIAASSQNILNESVKNTSKTLSNHIKNASFEPGLGTDISSVNFNKYADKALQQPVQQGKVLEKEL